MWPNIKSKEGGEAKRIQEEEKRSESVGFLICFDKKVTLRRLKGGEW